MDNSTSENFTHGPLDMLPEGPDDWGFWVKFISTPVIVFFGIMGNTLSVIVMKTKSLRHKSYSHYLCALAVFDSITLIIRLFITIDEYYIYYRNERGVFQAFNDAGCKIFNFSEHVSYLMSSWLVVLMALERLIAVCFPFRKVVIRSQSGAAIAICCLFVVMCISQCFRITMIESIVYDDFTDTRVCAAADQHKVIYTDVHVYFYQWTLAFALPVVLVFVCNILVMYQIFRVRREIKHKEKNTRCNRAVKKKHRTTCMLLIVSFTYIFTLLPLFTLTLIIDVSVKHASVESARSIYTSLYPFLEVSIAVSLINYAVNFFIYILSGKRFRFELRQIFYKEERPRRSFTAHGSTREEFIRL